MTRQQTETRDREDLKRSLTDAFRRAFPDGFVDISDGYADNIHVMVISHDFDHDTEQIKQERLWHVIDHDTDLSDAEKGMISLLYPLSPAEIK